jgi:hypothetical protein
MRGASHYGSERVPVHHAPDPSGQNPLCGTTRRWGALMAHHNGQEVTCRRCRRMLERAKEIQNDGIGS